MVSGVKVAIMNGDCVKDLRGGEGVVEDTKFFTYELINCQGT